MSDAIIINEVGLRDGLQNHPRLVATDDKERLLNALLKAGLRQLEPVSFVHPKIVPAMADAVELSQRLPALSGVEYTALVPNMTGYKLARKAGYKRVALVLAVTDTFNQRNINRSLEVAKAEFKQVLQQAASDGITTLTYLSCAMMCPYEGEVDPKLPLKLAEEMLAAGSDEIALADTIGGGTVRQMQQLADEALALLPASRLVVHLHDTRGTAQTLAWVACERGVRRFDASIGGLGGCPFAPGATGNVATEDLVYLFESAGMDTQIDMAQLREALAIARDVTHDAALGGRIVSYLESQEAAGRPCSLY